MPKVRISVALSALLLAFTISSYARAATINLDINNETDGNFFIGTEYVLQDFKIGYDLGFSEIENFGGNNFLAGDFDGTFSFELNNGDNFRLSTLRIDRAFSSTDDDTAAIRVVLASDASEVRTEITLSASTQTFFLDAAALGINDDTFLSKIFYEVGDDARNGVSQLVVDDEPEDISGVVPVPATLPLLASAIGIAALIVRRRENV